MKAITMKPNKSMKSRNKFLIGSLTALLTFGTLWTTVGPRKGNCARSFGMHQHQHSHNIDSPDCSSKHQTNDKKGDMAE